MKNDKKDSRRQFLKNASLTVLAAGALPSSIKAMSLSKEKPAADSSMLLCDQSTEDAYGTGPFYSAGAPTLQNNLLANLNEVGTRLTISGMVYNLGCTELIPNTELDIWQANDAGAYDNSGFTTKRKNHVK